MQPHVLNREKRQSGNDSSSSGQNGGNIWECRFRVEGIDQVRKIKVETIHW